MRESTNFDLQLYDGSDMFNPLSVENVNMESIDEQMKVNADYSVPKATAIKAGTVHNITRTNKDASMFHFTATSEYTAGETFTVDGNIVSVETSSGDSLQTGAFVIGAEVLCCLVGSVMTVFSSAGVDLSNVNAATLENHPASYFATEQDLSVTNAAAISAGNIANENRTRIEALEGATTTATTLISELAATGTFNLSDNIANYKYLYVDFYTTSGLSGGSLIPVALATLDHKGIMVALPSSTAAYGEVKFTDTTVKVAQITASSRITIYGIK